MKIKFFRLLILCGFFLIIAGQNFFCTTRSKVQNLNILQNCATELEIANPAAEKCIRDGYSLKPILTHGYVTDHFCVNPLTGRYCRVWDYFHGDCKLNEIKDNEEKKKGKQMEKAPVSPQFD